MLVRFPDEAEWEQLLAMYGDIEARSLGLPPVTRERRRDWLATLRETGWNLAAFDGERPVGHIAVAPADDPVPKFVVFVRDEYHGRGIGTELVKQAIAYAADRDHVALELTVESENRRAISVYTNVGFEVVSRGVDYRMELSLEDPAAETVQLPPGDRPSDG